jgi:hypothetical protein
MTRVRATLMPPNNLTRLGFYFDSRSEPGRPEVRECVRHACVCVCVCAACILSSCCAQWRQLCTLAHAPTRPLTPACLQPVLRKLKNTLLLRAKRKNKPRVQRAMEAMRRLFQVLRALGVADRVVMDLVTRVVRTDHPRDVAHGSLCAARPSSTRAVWCSRRCPRGRATRTKAGAAQRDHSGHGRACGRRAVCAGRSLRRAVGEVPPAQDGHTGASMALCVGQSAACRVFASRLPLPREALSPACPRLWHPANG